MAPEFGIYLNIGTIVSLVGVVGAGVWKISRIEKEIRDDGSQSNDELRDQMEAHIENISHDLQTLERDHMSRAETIRHEIGEVGAAIRQKIHDVEVFARDTFVPKEEFERSIDRIQNSIEKLGDRLEIKMDRMNPRRGQ